MSACPSPMELERFLDEALAADRQQAVSQHIGPCATCQAALEQLTRMTPLSGPPDDEPVPVFLQSLDRPPSFRGAPSLRGPATPSDGAPRPEVPGYEILAELGRGGMGVVYKARQVALNRIVALKMLQPGRSDRPRERERFRQEAEAVAQLRHPHIVHIYDIGEVNGRPYIALEHIEGGSLADRLHGEPQSVHTAARLVEALARAVHFAHQAGIVHRDLKPANVLLARRTGGPPVPGPEQTSRLFYDPKITDFGLAKKLDDPGTGTRSGEIVGTPSYMAPEQAGHGGEVGPAADIYALGAILYELITGRPPFRGATAVDTVVQLLHEEPVRPTSLRPDVPRDLETICLKCLEKAPRRRYANALTLADDLQRFRRGKPITARPVGTLERAAKWAQRHPLPAALAAGLCLVALLGFAGVTWQWRKTTRARDALFIEKENTVLEREQAEQARADAERQRRQARAALYYSRIAQSQLFWRVNDFDSARQSLLACRPAAGQEDRRGWEWYYLQGLYEPDLFTFSHGRPGSGGAVSYAPRGGALASVLTSAEPTGELCVWSAATGKLLLRQALAAGLQRLAFSPDGARLALAGADGAAIVLDTAKGREQLRATPHEGTISCIGYTPDGKQLVTGSWDHTLRVWSAETGKVLQVFRGHTDRVQDLAIHPGGKQIASASWDSTIRLWDVRTGKCERALPGHVTAVFSIAYSPDGKLLASAARNGNVKIWDVATGRVVQSLTGRAGAVLNVAFSPDGRYLAYGGSDATVRIWDVESAVERDVLRGHTAPVECVDFSPDGQRLVSCSPKDGTVRVWDLTHHPELATFAHADADLEALAFHADGRRVVSVAANGRVQRWDRATGVLLEEHLLPIATRLARAGPLVALTPAGDRVAAPSKEDGRVRIWETATGKEVLALDRPEHPVVGTCFSADGQYLATAHQRSGHPTLSHEVRVYGARTGRRLGTLTGAGPVRKMAFHPGGEWLARGGDGTVELAPWRSGGKRVTLKHGGEVHALAFSADGHRLAAAGVEDREIRTYHLTFAAAPARVRCELHHSTAAPRLLYDLAFSPDGKRLAGITRDLVKLWGVDDGVEILTLRGAAQRYWDAPFQPHLAFNADGTQLAGSNWDESFSIWSARAAEDARPADVRRATRRQAADARAVFWHLREAEQCLRHRNRPAAEFHLQRLEGAALSPPLQRRKEELTRRLAEDSKGG